MINLIDGPERLESPQGAVSSALWYWNKINLNSYADVEDIRGMTKRINGGYHGLDDRIAKYNKAKEILGASWQTQT
jgi:putative chitinase